MIAISRVVSPSTPSSASPARLSSRIAAPVR
jgi:hypothetical protein